MTVSDAIVNKIKEEKVNDVFLLSGGGMMYMLDALGRSALNLHFHNHEQDAGIAAEAYAKISGRPGVCFATSGPGGLNCVEAIAECWVDCVPVIFFIGQNKISQTTRASGIQGLRQHGASEIDILPILTPITKKTYLLDDPYEAINVIDEAWNEMRSGASAGPVAIIVPLDVQNAETEYNSILYEAEKAWQSAKKPLLLFGKGSKTHSDFFCRVCPSGNIPIVTTMAGKDNIPYNESIFIGHVGIKGDRAGNYAVQNADVIFCEGTSLHVFNTGYELEHFAPKAKIFYFEPDSACHKKCALGNATILPVSLYSVVEEGGHAFAPAWLCFLRSLKAKYPVYAEPHKEEEGRLNIYKALEIINEWSYEGDTIISDAGSAFYAVGQAWQLKKDQRYISSNGLGTMGWALPAATGAFIANKKRVLCFTGDGSFMTGSTELSVLAKNNIHAIIFVFNNEGYVSIRNTQDTFFEGRHVGTDAAHGVGIPSIVSMCGAYGVGSDHVWNESTLKEVLDWINHREFKGPMIVEIDTNFIQEIIPTVQSYTNADGKIVSGTLDNMYPYLEDK